MAYRVVVPQKVKKEFARIDRRYRARVLAVLAGLENNPYGGKKLEGERIHERSCRVWPYRIIYRIKARQSVVLIVKIGHRQGMY
ncbi:MAG: type II toxin-antitoxin system RelE/ParE family toxin [Patescibacteria group bacterium]